MPDLGALPFYWFNVTFMTFNKKLLVLVTMVTNNFLCNK